MSYALIAQGENLNDLSTYDTALQAGSRGQVLAYIDSPPTSEQLAQVEEKIVANGGVLTQRLYYDATIGAIVINFQQPVSQPNPDGIGFSVPPGSMNAIGLGLGALLTVGVLVFSWQLLQSMTSGAGVIWLLVGVIAVVAFLKSQEGKSTVKTGVSGVSYMGKAAIGRWEKGHFDKPTKETIKGSRDESSTYSTEPVPGAQGARRHSRTRTQEAEPS